MKNIIIIFSLLLFMDLNINAQTYVQGGIYANTTWTISGSPYIVTDSIVVFPGITLAIEPGVEVRFDSNIPLIIRQGRLIAIGTNLDSIKFTSNLSNPNKNDWDKIYINGGSLLSEFKYCKIEYSKFGIMNHYLNGNQNSTIDLNITNSRFFANFQGCTTEGNGGGFTNVEQCLFENNSRGIYGSQLKINNSEFSGSDMGINIPHYAFTYTYIANSKFHSNNMALTGDYVGQGAAFYSIKNSVLVCNKYGIVQGGYSAYVDTIYNCLIANNDVGILDSTGGGLHITHCVIKDNLIGIKLRKDTNKQIFCNKICNTNFSVFFAQAFANNLNISNNEWCLNDSLNISSQIWDGYDNFNLSLAQFMPYDVTQCYSTGLSNPIISQSCAELTGIDKILFMDQNDIFLYPNPMNTTTTIQFSKKINNVNFSVYNVYGQKVKTIRYISCDKFVFSRENLPDGIYYLNLQGEGFSKKIKLIITE